MTQQFAAWEVFLFMKWTYLHVRAKDGPFHKSNLQPAHLLFLCRGLKRAIFVEVQLQSKRTLNKLASKVTYSRFHFFS